jgi:hypothetical protein
VAEEEGKGSGGGALGGTVTLPGVGPVKKKIVVLVGTGAAAFVLWRYWQARQAGASADAAAQDPGMTDGGVLPSVAGAVKDDNSYGVPGGSSGTSDSYGFTGTTNSQWTQYAANQLSAASDKWSYGDVVEALGAFVNNRPLTTTQQQIVQAAIGLAGPPPEGTHPIIPGGNTAITVAPKNLRQWDTPTSTQLGLQWDAVAGAVHYRIFRSGQGEPVGDSADTKFHAQGLTPNTSYGFQVAAVTASNQVGPKSSTYTAKTKPVSLAKPANVRVTSVTKTSAVVSCSAVPGASGYLWYINHVAHGHSDGPRYTVVSLKPNTAYKLSVKADTTTQGPGPESGQVSFRTKK